MALSEHNEFEFLNKYIEDAMYLYWPNPTRDYYCRTCNFLEFPDQHTLEEHEKTYEHLLLQSSEQEAFCFVCQCHVYNSQMMKEHCQTKRHCKLVDIFEKSREDALKLWKGKTGNPPNLKTMQRDGNNENDKTLKISFSSVSTSDGKDSKSPLCDIQINAKQNTNAEKQIRTDNIEHILHSKDKSVTNLVKPKKHKRQRKKKIPSDPNEMLQKIKDAIRIINDECLYAEDVDVIKKRISYFLSTYKGVIIMAGKRAAGNLQRFAMRPYRKSNDMKKKGIKCVTCRISLASFQDKHEHNQSEAHKKLSYLKKKCKKICKTEAQRLLKKHKLATKNYSYMHSIIFPPEKEDLISKDYCYFCCQNLKGKSNHTKTPKHQRMLRGYFSRLKQNEYVYADGCAICEKRELDSIESHKSSEQHKLNIFKYKKSVGFIEKNKEKEEPQEPPSFNLRKRSTEAVNGGRKDTNHNNLLSTKDFIIAIQRCSKRKESTDETNKENSISLPPSKRSKCKS